MKENPPFIPDGSQTVGPYFRIGLEYLVDREPKFKPEEPGIVEITGRVLDANGDGVPDAMLEFWSPHASSRQPGYPDGFRRVGTDDEGRYTVLVRKPDAQPYPGGSQAPHELVLVFSRGLLRNLITRVYFGEDSANDADPVLSSLDPARRPTLVARPSPGRANAYEWDVILQGDAETVFFDW